MVRVCDSFAVLVLVALLAGSGCAKSSQQQAGPQHAEVRASGPKKPAEPVVAQDAAEPQQAVRLAEEADRMVMVNVDGALEKYELAHQQDPKNHRISYKLGLAYEKKEYWEQAEVAYAEAARLAPEFANYQFRHGYTLVKLAEAGITRRYEAAKAPLRRCIEADPNYAECYFFWGEACMQTLDDQCALEQFTKAIETNPKVSYFYPSLAELYILHKLYAEAEQVLTEGARLVPPTRGNRENLYGIHVLMIQTAQGQDDKRKMALWAEKAMEVAGDEHPETAFILGSTYAVMEPPKKDKAVRLLRSFLKRACRSARARKYKEQCEAAQSLIMTLP